MAEYLTKEEEVELVKRAQAGDVEARNAVILTVDKWIWKHAIRYAGRTNIDMAETSRWNIARRRRDANEP